MADFARVLRCKNLKCAMFIILIWLLSFLWGSIMSICGIIVGTILLCMRCTPHLYKGFIYFEIGYEWGGINLGPVFIVNKNASSHILKHELGHGIQNVIYGCLMPLLVSIPSFIRASYRKIICSRDGHRYKNLPAYESIWFEKQATEWGYRFCDLYDKCKEGKRYLG